MKVDGARAEEVAAEGGDDDVFVGAAEECADHEDGDAIGSGVALWDVGGLEFFCLNLEDAGRAVPIHLGADFAAQIDGDLYVADVGDVVENAQFIGEEGSDEEFGHRVFRAGRANGALEGLESGNLQHGSHILAKSEIFVTSCMQDREKAVNWSA